MHKEVRVSGVRSELDIEAAICGGADAIGVVCGYHDRGSMVNRHRARWLVETVPDGVASVVISKFTNAEDAVDLISRVRPDRIQLAAADNPKLAAIVHELGDRPDIEQVFMVKSDTAPETIETMKGFLPFIDYVHFEVEESTQPGSTEDTRNWVAGREMVNAAHEAGKLTVLSGGLTIDTVAAAIELTQPDSVAVEAGTKDICGSHDELLVARFVEAAKCAFNETAVLAA